MKDSMHRGMRGGNGTLRIFLPFFVFLLAGELIQGLGSVLCAALMRQGGAAADYITAYPGSVQVVFAAVSALAGLAAVYPQGGRIPVLPPRAGRGQGTPTGEGTEPCGSETDAEEDQTARNQTARNQTTQTQTAQNRTDAAPGGLFAAGRVELTTPMGMGCAAVFSVCLALFISILFYLTGLLEADAAARQAAAAENSAPLAAGLLVYGIVTPLAEEYVFRCVIFGRMQRPLGLRAAVIGSALLFGIYHGNLSQMLFAAGMGMVFAMFCARSGGIFVPLLCHAIVNALVFLLSTKGIFQEMVTPVWAAAMAGLAALTGYLLFARRR